MLMNSSCFRFSFPKGLFPEPSFYFRKSSRASYTGARLAERKGGHLGMWQSRWDGVCLWPPSSARGAVYLGAGSSVHSRCVEALFR